MAGGSSGPSGPIAGINVTPLVDVVLVLLIVLMVTASAIVSQSIPLDLPQAATGESTEAPLTLSIDRDGAYYLDGEASTREAIDAHLVTLGESAASLRVVLEADGARPHAEVIGLIDLVRRHGVVHFAMHVQPTETARSETDSATP